MEKNELPADLSDWSDERVEQAWLYVNATNIWGKSAAEIADLQSASSRLLSELTVRNGRGFSGVGLAQRNITRPGRIESPIGLEILRPLGWTYDGSSDYSIGPADDPQVNRVATIHSRDSERGSAYAALFSAAPDLLDALESLWMDCGGGADDIRIQVESAIAKARGRG